MSHRSRGMNAPSPSHISLNQSALMIPRAALIDLPSRRSAMYTNTLDTLQSVVMAVAANASDDDDAGGCFNPKYPWANKYLGYCIHRDIEVASLVCGLLSIAFWMVAQMPFVRHMHGSCLICRMIRKARLPVFSEAE